MIEWYNDDELSIFFSGVPKVRPRIPLPSSSEEEIESMNKYPFINKRTLDVAIFDHMSKKIYKFTIPKGYLYDGATIPKFFWRIIGANTDNRFIVPAMIHDQLCEHHDYVDNDRKLSTKVFDALLKVSKVHPFKRFLMKHPMNIFQMCMGWNKKKKKVK